MLYGGDSVSVIGNASHYIRKNAEATLISHADGKEYKIKVKYIERGAGAKDVKEIVDYDRTQYRAVWFCGWLMKGAKVSTTLVVVRSLHGYSFKDEAIIESMKKL